jgi:hypothetical protein
MIMILDAAHSSGDSMDRIPLPTKERKCSVDNCQARHYAKDYCKKHYAQVLRHGKLTPERERGAVRVCLAEGCNRTDTIRWYCRKHARQIRVHGHLTPDREHVMGFEGCRVPRCDEPHRAKGFCAKHYNQDRWRRLKLEREAAAKGKKARARRLAKKRPSRKR